LKIKDLIIIVKPYFTVLFFKTSPRMRQLAAIMFSDMVGYTALMQQNEQLATKRRRKLKDVLESSLSAHAGKLLQFMATAH